MLEVIKQTTFTQYAEYAKKSTKLVLEPGLYEIENACFEEGNSLFVDFIEHGTMRFASGSVKMNSNPSEEELINLKDIV